MISNMTMEKEAIQLNKIKKSLIKKIVWIKFKSSARKYESI